MIIEEAPLQEAVASIPTNLHQFQRKRYWAEAAVPGAGRKLNSVHPLLGEMRRYPNDTISFENTLQLASLPYLKEHQVYDSIIYPGAWLFRDDAFCRTEVD